MEQHALKHVNNCLNTNIYSYLEAPGGQNSNLYLNVVSPSTPVLIRHLWQLRTVIFMHWCLIHTVLFNNLSHSRSLKSVGEQNQLCKTQLIVI
jgi:hypothetical protein